MAEFIITSYRKGYLGALKEGNRITEFHCQKSLPVQVGDIYIGKIQNILKNLNAAFVSLGKDLMAYLDLSKEASFLYTRQARPGRATIGDELVVQLEKEAVKTKLPVVTGHMNLSGQSLVLIHGEPGINFSRKIHDQAFKRMVSEEIADKAVLPDSCGLIVRTNATEYSCDQILEEIKILSARYEKLVQTAPYRTCFSKLYEELQVLGKVIRDYPLGEELSVITDQESMYKSLREAFPDRDITYYDDQSLSLKALYSIDHALKEATGKHVWLKSGGYLVIEPTEALTVIDVNTGKSIQTKNKESHFLAVNKEAARELAIQLRLRNYSGIILVDFIDLKDRDMNQELLHVLRQELKKDRTKTSFVDMTGLNLAEITRKRITRPLHEALAELTE